MGVIGLYGCKCHQFRSWQDLNFYTKQQFKPDDIVKLRHSGKFALIIKKDQGRFYSINVFPCQVERDKTVEHASLLIPLSKFSAAEKKQVGEQMEKIILNNMATTAKTKALSKKGLNALLDKGNPTKGKRSRKIEIVPEIVKKPHFEVLIRIPWEAYDICMEYGKRKQGYKEKPTFNGSLKNCSRLLLFCRKKMKSCRNRLPT